MFVFLCVVEIVSSPIFFVNTNLLLVPTVCSLPRVFFILFQQSYLLCKNPKVISYIYIHKENKGPSRTLLYTLLCVFIEIYTFVLEKVLKTIKIIKIPRNKKVFLDGKKNFHENQAQIDSKNTLVLINFKCLESCLRCYSYSYSFVE